MTPDQISYALSKQVPDMQRGFTIQTAYGDLVIPAGYMAERLAARMRLVLEVELVARWAQGPAA